jgi:hypothetical protein
VITDNVIIRLMLSDWPGPKSLYINYYIKHLDIVITIRILLLVWSFLNFKYVNLSFFQFQSTVSINSCIKSSKF